MRFFLFACVLLSQMLFGEAPKTVLVTGGAGFIGSNFLEYMFAKHPAYRFLVLDALTYAGSLKNIPDEILSSDRFEFFHGSVCDEKLVDQLVGRSNFVVHFAAETHVARSIEDDIVFVDTDVMGTRMVLAALARRKGQVERFIHISTSEVYGTAESKPMPETHPLNPRSPYAAAKAGADRLVYSYFCTFGIPAVIARPFNNYGPRQHEEKLVPHLIAQAVRGEPLTIHGNGLQTRDWLHTADLAKALDGILHFEDFEKIRGQEFNIGTEREVSVLEIARGIIKAMGLGEERMVFVEDRQGQVAGQIAGIGKARDVLGWEPEIGLEEGLKRTVDWYLSHPEFWRGQ